MSARRVQRTRTRGGGMPRGAIYVGRPSLWGNPFVVKNVDGVGWVTYRVHGESWTFKQHPDRVSAAQFAVEAYRRAIAADWEVPSAAEIRARLHGFDLACWCPPDMPCHGDVLLDIANTDTTDTLVEHP